MMLEALLPLKAGPSAIPPLARMEKGLWLRLPSYRFALATVRLSLVLLFSSMQPKILFISAHLPWFGKKKGSCSVCLRKMPCSLNWRLLALTD
jgi:hypothetical protein